jgi:Tfp pilus assembly protein PilX
MVMLSRRRESGAVSLFLVIFAMLLITVITLSFVRTMVADQSQSSLADLSQSAHDSSLAGTEDAKRALIYYRTVCTNGSVADCATATAALNSPVCNEGLTTILPDIIPNQEVKIQQTQSSTDTNGYDQAYTCVKVTLDTPDYLGTADANTSQLIPLKADGDINTVTVQWYMPSDLGSSSANVSLIGDSAVSKPLYLQTNWPANRPSLLRAQLMQVGANFTLADFDTSNTVNSDTNTVFLYPTGTTGTARTVTNPLAIAQKDIRKTPTGAPQPVKCTGKLSAGGYACSVTLTLPQAIGQTDDSRTAYLRLTPMYNSTHFRVTLGGATGSLNFSGVQPSIDSTGRASTQYSRVETRVDLSSTNLAFPEAAIDLTGNLCKDFVVTDNASDYANSCTP